MSRTVIRDFAELDKYFDLYEYKLEDGFIGNATVISHSTRNVFLTDFQPDDVDYFYDCFIEVRANFNNVAFVNSLDSFLLSKINIWKKGKSISPIEPYLYALKLVDRCVGSMKDGSEPSRPMLNAIGKALSHFWNTSIAEDNRIVKHIMVNWDWYQPVLVAINMCENLSDFFDDEIDEILRERLLFSKMFASSSFYALVRRFTEENFRTLFNCVLKGAYEDTFTKFPILVSNKMVDAFCDAMTRHSTEEIFDLLKNEYSTKFHTQCTNKRAKKRFDDLFNMNISSSKIEKIFSEYSMMTSMEKKDSIDYLNIHFSIGLRESYTSVKLISDDELLEFVLRKLKTNSSFGRSYAIFYLGFVKLERAQKYLSDQLKQISASAPEWLVYACASNISCGNPGLKSICSEFFLNNIGLSYKSILGLLIRHKQSEFKSIAPYLVDEVLGADWITQKHFVEGLSEMCQYWSNYITNAYPTEFDQVLRMLFSTATKEQDYFYIMKLLDIVDIVCSSQNRMRYYQDLMDITINFPPASNIHSKATNIIRRVFQE